ncbi:MAG: F0F1 ATP synthase subunit B [Panacagrimonas sp.]
MNLNATLLFQMVAFGLFVWFTMKYVFPPITTAMRERQNKIADGLAAAEKGAKSLEDAAAKSDDAIKQARSQAQDILAAANKQASQMVEQAKQTAKDEADRIVNAAQEEVGREVTRAREELRKSVGALAVSGAEKILGREIDASAHAEVLDQLATQV